MKNIKIKCIVYTVLISFCSTKLHAQKQWNLNAYHNYSSYIDLNCSLNGESNGTEAFLFYADNRSESKISFTVNYTITDNCGKSHSGSWSTYIIQAGQRGSTVESVYTGCPIQKGKGHLVKNITCTVSNFKDLSKNESNSTSSSTNTSSNSSFATTQSASQGQYRQQQESTTESQSEALSKQLVEDGTELVGMVSNLFASNSAAREKKLLKRAAAKSLEEKEKAQNATLRKIDKESIEKYRTLGSDITIDQLVDLYSAYYNLGDYANYKFELKRATDHFEALLLEPALPSEEIQFIYESTSTGGGGQYYNTGSISILKVLAQINSKPYGNKEDGVKWQTLYIDHYENSSDPLLARMADYYMDNLAHLYFYGEFNLCEFCSVSTVNQNSARPDIPKAIYWYTRIANKGKKNYTTAAMYKLYEIYTGRSQATKEFKDKAKAKEWYKKYEIANKAGL